MIATFRIHAIAEHKLYSSSPSSNKSSLKERTSTRSSASKKCCPFLWTTTSGRLSPCHSTGTTSHRARLIVPSKIRVLMRSLKTVRSCQIITSGAILTFKILTRPRKFTHCSQIIMLKTRTVSSDSITPSTSCAGRLTHRAFTLNGLLVSVAKTSLLGSLQLFLSR